MLLHRGDHVEKTAISAEAAWPGGDSSPVPRDGQDCAPVDLYHRVEGMLAECVQDSPCGFTAREHQIMIGQCRRDDAGEGRGCCGGGRLVERFLRIDGDHQHRAIVVVGQYRLEVRLSLNPPVGC